MEEILSSIRRIISEDGEQAPAPDGGAPRPAAERQSMPTPERPPMRQEEPAILDLTEVVQDDGTVVSLNRQPPRRAMPEPEPPQMAPPFVVRAAASPPPQAPDVWGGGMEGLVSRDTESAATQAFAGLAGTLTAVKGVPFGSQQRTLEELVRELLRPMLKQWLDRNLQPIVVRAVEREISRLSGRAEKN